MTARRDELMTVPQLLEELGGVSRRTFFRWRELGRAPPRLETPPALTWMEQFYASTSVDHIWIVAAAECMVILPSARATTSCSASSMSAARR